MNLPQKCAILSLVWLSLAPLHGLAVEPQVAFTHQSLHGFKLSIVNMPINAELLLKGGVGNKGARDALVIGNPFDHGQHQVLANEWQLSYEFDDLSLSFGSNITMREADEHPFEEAILQQAMLTDDALAQMHPRTHYWRLGSEYQAMDWLTLSLNFQQDMAAQGSLFFVGSEMRLNPTLSLQFIGFMGSDASKGALLQTRYHF